MVKILKNHLLLLSITIFAYFFFRIFNIHNNVNFSDDQGKILLSVFDIWENKNFTLLGPPTSFSFEGRYFYHGPLTLYVLLPAMIIGHWNVLFGSYLTIASNFISLILIYIATKKLFGKPQALLAALLFAVFPETVYYTKFIWNPNFLPLTASAVLALMVGVGKFGPKLRAFLIAVMFGLGLQFHYQFILVILPASLYLMFKSKEKGKTALCMILGFILGYLPILLFEFRNSFYNTQTIILLIQNKSFLGESQPPSYYFLSLFPFLFSFVAGLLFWIKKKYRIISVSVIAIVILSCVISSVFLLFDNKGMPKNWRYVDAERVSKIIADEELNNYNVANLISGDTRAYSLRYLLKINRSEPLSETDYPNAENLFALSYLNDTDTESYPVWEVSSFGGQVKRKWLIKENPDIYLYLLTKESTPKTHY